MDRYNYTGTGHGTTNFMGSNSLSTTSPNISQNTGHGSNNNANYEWNTGFSPTLNQSQPQDVLNPFRREGNRSSNSRQNIGGSSYTNWNPDAMSSRNYSTPHSCHQKQQQNQLIPELDRSPFSVPEFTPQSFPNVTEINLEPLEEDEEDEPLYPPQYDPSHRNPLFVSPRYPSREINSSVTSPRTGQPFFTLSVAAREYHPRTPQGQSQPHYSPENHSQGQSHYTPNNQSQGQFIYTPNNQSQGQSHYTPNNHNEGQFIYTPKNQTQGQSHYTPHSGGHSLFRYSPQNQREGQPAYQQTYGPQTNLLNLRTLNLSNQSTTNGYENEIDGVSPNKSDSDKKREFHLKIKAAQEMSESESLKCVEAVTNAVVKISVDPTGALRVIQRTVDFLQENLKDVETLEKITNIILEKGITKLGFTYLSSKLCEALRSNNIKVGDITFHQQFVNMYEKEFVTCLKNTDLNEEMRRRTRRLTLLSSELYLHFNVDKMTNARNNIFGYTSLELMTKLLSLQPVTTDHFGTVYNTLKLIGWELDQDPRVEVKHGMDKLFDSLGLLRNLPGIEIYKQIKDHMNTLFELRANNWNKESDLIDFNSSLVAEKVVSETSTAIVVENVKSQDTVNNHDDTWNFDMEPEEVQQAFEVFLQKMKKP